MAAPFGGSPTLAECIACLEELGCKITELSGDLVSEDGVFRVRYALNPANGKFVVLSDHADNDRLTPWVIGNIERRLKLITGFPSI